MKKFMLVPLLFLAACGDSGNVNSTPTPLVCADGGIASNIIMDDKAYAGALVLYNVPAHAYKVSVERGQLIGEKKVTIRGYLIKAYDSLQLLKAAYDIGDTSSFRCQYAALSSASADAKSLLGVR